MIDYFGFDWIPFLTVKEDLCICLCRYDAQSNTYQLDCKAFADPDHVRAAMPT